MNPKTHDSLFKWLITAFTAEFFAHYFPAVRVGSYTFIDKEFIHAVAEMKGQLTDEHLLLVDQWMDAYKKIPDKTVDQIRQETDMTFIATTLTDLFC